MVTRIRPYTARQLSKLLSLGLALYEIRINKYLDYVYIFRTTKRKQIDVNIDFKPFG